MYILKTDCYLPCVRKKFIFNKKKCIDSRISYRRCSLKRVFLKNFAQFTEKHLCWSLFFNKVVTLRPATLLKERIQ